MAVPKSGVPTAILINRAKEVTLKVVIGVDPHKGSHTEVAVDDHEARRPPPVTNDSGEGGRDWFAWHGAYDDPDSDLRRRLGAVQGFIAEALTRQPPGRIRVVSVCAGQARDLLGVLRGHRRHHDVVGRLVELDPRNVEVARAAYSHLGHGELDIVCDDASTTAAYEGAVPADLVLVCGVFGHASDEDISAMIGWLPTMCAAGATVVWTRGAAVADLRPTIRRWFRDRGFEEVGFASADGTGWGVGANRMVVDPEPYQRDVRLFTFLDDLRRR